MFVSSSVADSGVMFCDSMLPRNDAKLLSLKLTVIDAALPLLAILNGIPPEAGDANLSLPCPLVIVNGVVLPESENNL